MTTYGCDCGTRTTTSDDLPTCVSCGGFLFPEDETTRLRVGDRVSLHHAKGKDRKLGTVVSVGRTNVKIDLPRWKDDGFLTTTTRRLDDLDVLVVR